MTGCGSAWLERLVWDQEVAGSNPVTPIIWKLCASGSGVEHHLAKVGAAGSNPVSRFFIIKNCGIKESASKCKQFILRATGKGLYL